jgi:hypothetical protein
MKTPIKILKRDDRKVTRDKEISSLRTERRRQTDVIVKNWIIESRERRRAVLKRLAENLTEKSEIKTPANTGNAK